MKLNCKTGDLAIVVRGPMNLGRVVTIIAPATRLEVEMALRGPFVHSSQIWRIDAPLLWGAPFGDTYAAYAPDECLRPIRPGEGEDEMLRIAGLPAPRETTTA